MAQYPAANTSVTPSKLVTKSNTAGCTSLGSVSLTGAGTNTPSAWGQVSASLASDSLVTSFMVVSAQSFSGTGLTNVDLAIGGAGSESTLATVPLCPVINLGTANKIAQGKLDIPVRIAAGQRLTARITDTVSNNLNGVTVTVYVYGVPYVNVEGN